MSGREPPPAYPHGALQELFDDVFFVTGSARMPGLIPWWPGQQQGGR